jgi:hypothetical protein
MAGMRKRGGVRVESFWKVLKKPFKKEGRELVTKCNRPKKSDPKCNESALENQGRGAA